MKKIFLLICCCHSLFLYSQPASGRQGISVNPVTVSFQLLPGQTEGVNIQVTNYLPGRKEFSAYLNDWLRDSLGGHIYLPPGSESRTCASWVSLDKTFFVLEPGQTEILHVTFTAPASDTAARQMRWAMLFIETVEEQTASNESGVTTTIHNRFRVGIHLYQTPPTITRKEIKLLGFKPLGDTLNTYRMICQNSGEVQVHCISYLELAPLEGGKPEKLPAQEFPMFPDQRRYIDFRVPDSIPRGKYMLTGVVDAGSDIPLEAAQLIIDLK